MLWNRRRMILKRHGTTKRRIWIILVVKRKRDVSDEFSFCAWTRHTFQRILQQYQLVANILVSTAVETKATAILAICFRKLSTYKNELAGGHSVLLKQIMLNASPSENRETGNETKYSLYSHITYFAYCVQFFQQ